MNRRQILAGLGAVLVAPAAYATTDADSVEWRGELTGCFCKGCGAKLEAKLKALPGVKSVTVDIENGKLLVVSSRETKQREIVTTVGKSEFKLVKLDGPTPRKS